MRVQAYGQSTPLKHLSNSKSQGQKIIITPYDNSIISSIVKACKLANFDAYKYSKDCVIVNLPIMSGDTKKETIQRIKALGGETKVAVRNIRQQFRQGQPKEKRQDKEIQEITDSAISIINDIVETKTSYIK